MRTGIETLCDPVPSQIADEDLFDICSGHFAPTQDEIPPKASAEDTNDPEVVSEVATSSNDVNLSSPPRRNAGKILDSSDDEASPTANVEKSSRKNYRKRKQIKKLNFSDDEDEAAADETSDDEAEESSEEQQEDEEDILVDYDSEENEIEVKMKIKDRIQAAGAYFEQEAELSESEWGSADEDEKDLDQFDIELGDEDKYDQNQLQEEVGRIHARKMLDDDIRRVKKIEDLLFMDEENDGVGRERKFRWKNQTEAFSLEDESATCDAPIEGEFTEENEILWRKMRHERETALREQSQNASESNSMNEGVLVFDHDSQRITSSSVGTATKRKFQIIKTPKVIGLSSNCADSAKANSPFLIKTTNLKNFHNSSFLSRDEKTLNKIAHFVSNKNDEVTNLTSHGSTNLSFTTIEKANDGKKRRTEENSSAEPNKKRKLEPKKQLLLDRLI